MGATLVTGGATIRTWAPGAKEVYVVPHDFDIATPGGWTKNPGDLLQKDSRGYWTGFFSGVKENDPYRFWIVGTGNEGYKRDPYARELEMYGYPNCNCLVRDGNSYRWHDGSYHPPAFNDLIIYQLHIGVFFAEDAWGHDIRKDRVAKFLDVVGRIRYLADLGVNAIMLLPFQEFQGPNSKGYNGTDLFSPEMDYTVDAKDLARYVTTVNQLLALKGQPPLSASDITGQDEQLKILVDLCHLFGIAVIADVVYNHAGPGFDSQSLRLFDRPASPATPDGVFFSNNNHVGPVFDYSQAPVRQFLIDNAIQLLTEYHLDGLRFDQVTVIDQFGGWFFSQDLTATIRWVKPSAVQIAEYWGNQRWRGVVAPPNGMAFDVGYDDRLRDSLREVIEQSTGGRSASVNFDRLRDSMYPPWGFPHAWQTLQYIENHDLLDNDHSGGDKRPRIARLSDSTNARSWYARSRSRVATSLLLTAPGIPFLFMGEEFLEDKYWSDNPARHDLAIYWAGLAADKHMSDFHRFARDLLWLRRKHPALRSEGTNIFYVHNDDRIFAFHRWIPNVGRDVLVVASLNESTFYNRSYKIGFPRGGHWHEVFNSDVYDNWFNPVAQGNYGGVDANGAPMHNLPTSAAITIPANSVLVFAKDVGDF
jgi:1,4-alpha-glucan branching enzyme